MAADSSEETVVSTPRFDGRAEERARPVVPLADEAEEVTRVRKASVNEPWAGVAGPKNFRRYALVVLPLIALLAAAALAIQQRGRPADAQLTPPASETPSAAVAAPAERAEDTDRRDGERSRPVVRREREAVGAGGGRDGWRPEGRGEGRGEEGKGEREGRGKDRDKKIEERVKKEREKYRERAKEAGKEFKRLKELFKDN